MHLLSLFRPTLDLAMFLCILPAHPTTPTVCHVHQPYHTQSLLITSHIHQRQHLHNPHTLTNHWPTKQMHSDRASALQASQQQSQLKVDEIRSKLAAHSIDPQGAPTNLDNYQQPQPESGLGSSNRGREEVRGQMSLVPT